MEKYTDANASYIFVNSLKETTNEIMTQQNFTRGIFITKKKNIGKIKKFIGET